MRTVVILALVACTGTESDPDAERLNDFFAKTVNDCGGYIERPPTWCGLPDVQAQQLLACMNDALTTGDRAMTTIGLTDSHLFNYDQYVFTVDYRVQVFDRWPSGNPYANGPYVVDNGTCAGPFRLVESIGPCTGYKQLTWDGCL